MTLPMVETSTIDKNLQRLTTLSQSGFSGRLTFQKSSNPEWVLVMQSGKIAYATGGRQPLRRWYRHILWAVPELAVDFRALQAQLSAVTAPLISNCPDYHLLHSWALAGRISGEQLRLIVEAIATEVLFDIVQAADVVCDQHADMSLLNPEQLVGSDIVLSNVMQLWQRWQAADLPNYPLNRVPVVVQAGRLKASTSPQVYKTLMAILDGKRSLWEIAAKTRKDVIQIVRPLHPFLSKGWIELTDHVQLGSTVTSPSSPQTKLAPVVACVDDSIMVCRALETITKSVGYGFVGIADPARAIATLLARKPKLIFLDLIMPETNGYEICSQLRKTTQFKETPIIILTGNDGVVDQVRARLLGATDFIGKPIDPAIISNIIHKYVRMPN